MSETPKLAEALAKAQAQMGKAGKDRANPFFKSRYATLESVFDACREALNSNGIAIVQMPTLAPEGFAGLDTRLLHTSGESIGALAHIPLVKKDPQAYGSAITYLRRYALAAIAGVVVEEDDDANAAAGKSTRAPEGDQVDREVAAIRAAVAFAKTVADVDALATRFNALPAADKAALRPLLSARKAELGGAPK